MKYYVYKITNRIDGKYYIGKRAHRDPVNDHYMGSGERIKRAIRKYGHHHFDKQIIEIFRTDKEASALEEKLVNLTTLNDPLCYNLHRGGNGGWEHINSVPTNQRKNFLIIRKLRAEGRIKRRVSCITEKQIAAWTNTLRSNKSIIGLQEFLKDETRVKARNMKISAATKKNNPTRGKVWCVESNAIDCYNRKIFHPNEIPDGWITCSEYKDRKKKRNSSYGKFWFNDGSRNYLRTPEFAQGLTRGRIKS